MKQFDIAFNGQTRYRISYFNNLTSFREYYLNNTTFSRLEDAEREVGLLKNVEKARKGICPFKKRTRFKIEPYVVKNAMNREIR